MLIYVAHRTVLLSVFHLYVGTVFYIDLAHHIGYPACTIVYRAMCFKTCIGRCQYFENSGQFSMCFRCDLPMYGAPHVCPQTPPSILRLYDCVECTGHFAWLLLCIYSLSHWAWFVDNSCTVVLYCGVLLDKCV